MSENIALKKIEKAEEYVILRELWREYVTALSEYKEFEETAENIAKEEVRPQTYRDDYMIFLKNTPVGFLITGTYPNAFSKGDIYIQEIFIKKEYRRKGIGKKVIEKRLKRTKKDISLYVLKNNEPAKAFWINVMRELGYEDRFNTMGAEATTNDGLLFKYFLHF